MFARANGSEMTYDPRQQQVVSLYRTQEKVLSVRDGMQIRCLHGFGMRRYRSSDLIGDTHAVIDTETGAVINDHVDR